MAGQTAAAIDQRETGRVIAAVLESAQTLKENFSAVPLSGDRDNATH
jgi:hypothetical protein